jgi:hypothetical protein
MLSSKSKKDLLHLSTIQPMTGSSGVARDKKSAKELATEKRAAAKGGQSGGQEVGAA